MAYWCLLARLRCSSYIGGWQVYYRDDYEKPALVRSWKSCFQKRQVMDRYLRHVVMIFAYTYQKARLCTLSCWRWCITLARSYCAGNP